MKRTQHRPVVRSRMTPWGRDYRSECTCSAFSAWVQERGAAVHARDHHLWGVAAPPEDRCREPKAHGTKWWDACLLCANQMALPGFEDLGATG